jgi:hypothetical protein
MVRLQSVPDPASSCGADSCGGDVDVDSGDDVGSEEVVGTAGSSSSLSSLLFSVVADDETKAIFRRGGVITTTPASMAAVEDRHVSLLTRAASNLLQL